MMTMMVMVMMMMMMVVMMMMINYESASPAASSPVCQPLAMRQRRDASRKWSIDGSH